MESILKGVGNGAMWTCTDYKKEVAAKCTLQPRGIFKQNTWQSFRIRAQNQIAAQRRGFDLERRSSGVSALWLLQKKSEQALYRLLRHGTSKHYGCRSGYDASASWTSSRAIRTAAITKAEKVQFLLWIAFSTSSTTSLGNRMVLLIVGGVDGIWNLPIDFSSQYICIATSLYHHFLKVCIAFAMHTWYHGIEVI